MHIQKKKLTSINDAVWDVGDDNISLALMNRLKARIARRESRLKHIPFNVSSEDTHPHLLPAA